jgi:hypothetical protein
MAKLTTAKRESLLGKEFAQPATRSYPIPDKSHAINAKARATQQVNKGNLTQSAANKIDARANKVIAGKK